MQLHPALLLLLLLGISEYSEGLLKCPGPCTPPLHCRSLGGRILGYCLNHKACCDYTNRVVGGCGEVLEDSPVVYFQSPGYPGVSGGDLLCSFDLLLSPSTLGVRVDFVEVAMGAIPNNPVDYGGGSYPLCDSDMFFLRGFRGWSPDPRCGNLSGYSVLVEREEGEQRVSLVMVMSSAAYKWNIRLTQLSRLHYANSYELLLNTAPPEEDEGGGGGDHKAYLSGFSRPPPPPPPSFRMREGIRFSSEEEAGRPVSRIGGGEDAPGDEGIPWQVSIQTVLESESDLCGERVNRSSHICGGSILDDRTILSAAHCFLSSARFAHPTTLVSNLKVVVGTSDLCSSSASTSTHLVSAVTLHVNYVSTELLNDLAVLHLSSPIPTWTPSLRPIPLATSPPDPSTPLILSGWGSKGLEDNATYPATLQVTSDLLLLPPAECEERQAKYLNFLPSPPPSPKYKGAFDSVLCVRGGSPGVEAGYGDSGGPLASGGALIGVVSHMRPDADPNGTFHVDLFVNVQKYVKWIVLAAVPPLPLT